MAVLFDSSFYIQSLRTAGEIQGKRWMRDEPIWLSSVVLEELYAGAGLKEARVIEKLERDFAKAGRVLVPTLSDWTKAGKILAAVGQRLGYERIGRSRLSNDALIAASAARMGICVITANRGDFAVFAGLCPLDWRQSE